MDAGESLSVQLGDLRLAACYWSGEGVPVIALHGWLDNAASFVPLAQELSGVPLLALELPGHGHSDYLPTGVQYHLADNLYAVVAAAEFMGWRQFMLLGHSMGAAISTLVAAALPERILGMVLLDGLGPLAVTPEMEIERLRQLFSAPKSRAESQRPLCSVEGAVRLRQRYGRFSLSREAATAIVRRNLRRCDGGFVWRYDERLNAPSSHYYSEQQVVALLGAIACPTLLLSATDGALAAWSEFAARCEAVKGLQHHLLPGGHYLHMESAAEVAVRVSDFYDRLEFT